MKKGFDTARIRECFQVLRKSSMILHGYFILGSIGESVEEMRQTLPFARELGLDSIAISLLRTSPLLRLEETRGVESRIPNRPNGKIYSAQCSVDDLRKLRREIYRGFFTPAHLVRIARKGVRNGALRFLPTVLPQLPRLAWRAVRSSRQHARRRRARRGHEVMSVISAGKETR